MASESNSHEFADPTDDTGMIMNRGKVRIPIDEIAEAVRGRKVGVLTNGLVWLEEAGDDLAGLIRRACREEVLLFADPNCCNDATSSGTEVTAYATWAD